MSVPRTSWRPCDLSVVVPVYEERASLRPLHARIRAALDGRDYEVVYVDDGSRDGSDAVLAELAATDPRVRVVRLSRNHGQTAAMAAGFDRARGRVIAALDGDGQNDPADLPLLLAKLDEGHDVVSGWRRDRKDAVWDRVLPSRLGNLLIGRLSGVRLHDYGCTLKVYRREVLEGLRLYGDAHRLLVVQAAWRGARVAELPVRHHARSSGRSSYGLSRLWRVPLDVLAAKFLDRYATRPMQGFGGLGLLALASGVVLLTLGATVAPSGVVFALGAASLILGGVGLLAGLVAESFLRTTYDAGDRRSYRVESDSGPPTARAPVPRGDTPNFSTFDQ